MYVWQDEMEFCDLIYRYTETIPVKEKYNLISQLERCAVSIPSNIAEGPARRTNNHFAEFLSISLSSAYEAETQLFICHKRNYGNAEEVIRLINKVQSLQTKLYKFRETIEAAT